MKMIQSWFVAAVMIGACVFLISKPACADTFQVFDLGIDNRSLIGIDDSGTVVFLSHEFFSDVYEIWTNGNFAGISMTPPSLKYDNGIPCVPTTSAGIKVFGGSRCNDGYEVYGGEFGSPINPSHGIFTGPNLSDLLIASAPYPGDIFYTGTVDTGPGPYLNALRDFVWDDGKGDEYFEAIDLTTLPVPETGSFFLLGTGALTILGLFRRR
jgi:hypothetical protein